MKTLREIIVEVHGHDVDLRQWLHLIPEELHKAVLESNYYWGLASYIDLYNVQRVLEFGTCTGTSAVIMAMAGATVDTYDIEDKWACAWPENVNRLIADNPRYIEQIDLTPYDLVFVDIEHDGKEEFRIHQKLVAEYKGYAFYDDIFMNETMRAFWGIIKQEKQALTWHDMSGFGLVRYG